MSILRLCLTHLLPPTISHSAWSIKSAQRCSMMQWMEQAHAAQEVCVKARRHFLWLPVWNMTSAWAPPHKLSIFSYPRLAHDCNEVKVWHQLACNWDSQQLWTSALQAKFKGYCVDHNRTGRASRWRGLWQTQNTLPLPSNGLSIWNNHNNC